MNAHGGGSQADEVFFFFFLCRAFFQFFCERSEVTGVWCQPSVFFFFYLFLLLLSAATVCRRSSEGFPTGTKKGIPPPPPRDAEPHSSVKKAELLTPAPKVQATCAMLCRGNPSCRLTNNRFVLVGRAPLAPWGGGGANVKPRDCSHFNILSLTTCCVPV